MKGCVQILLLKELPPLLKYLLGLASSQKDVKFHKNIRAYNSMFVFTSIGGRVDTTINRAKSSYVFRISGQNFHRINSLLPEVRKKSSFA